MLPAVSVFDGMLVVGMLGVLLLLAVNGVRRKVSGSSGFTDSGSGGGWFFSDFGSSSDGSCGDGGGDCGGGDGGGD